MGTMSDRTHGITTRLGFWWHRVIVTTHRHPAADRPEAGVTAVMPARDHVTIGLVSCGKKKADRACAARDLYRGELFRRASAYAERTYEHWFILSAQHYLVHPDEVLDPYEKSIASMSVAARRHWALIVESNLRLGHGAASEGRHEFPVKTTPHLMVGAWITASKQTGARRSVDLYLHVGSDYAEPLLERFATMRHDDWQTVHRPLRGLGINVLLYTPCTAYFTVNPSMNGQILAGTGITATNQFTLNFDDLAAFDVPGTTSPLASAVAVQSKTVSSGWRPTGPF